MQPTYLPWVGYFDLMDQVDSFVILDDVQFSRQSWQQRNRIKTPKQLEWVTVPVLLRGRFGQLINAVEIQDPDFWKSHLRALEVNYGRSPYFAKYFHELVSIFEQGSPWTRLVDLNTRLIEWIALVLGLKTPLVKSSQLNARGQRSTRLVALCESLGAKEYLSPIGSAIYLLQDLDEFKSRNVEVFFQNYSHPTYNQLFQPFVPFASVIDILFNEGAHSMEVIRSGRGMAYSPEDVRSLVHIEAEVVEAKL